MSTRPIECSPNQISKAISTPTYSYQETDRRFIQGTCPILDIPVESLTHITSFLPLPSLIALSRTNRRLYDHIQDDNTWYRAFINQYLDIGPENDINIRKIILLRKSDSTWRKEFTTRHSLRERWQSSSNGTITYSPQVIAIDSVQLMPENGLLTSSIPYGVITRSVPLNGIVLEGYLNAAGTGLLIGNPTVELTPRVSACSLTSDGGTAKAFWGKRNGEVAVTTAPRVMDPLYVSSKLMRCKRQDQHDGFVNEIALDPLVSRFVSAGADGQVKLWDTETVVCLWSSDKQLQSRVVDPFLKVSSALADGIIIGALNSGDIILWSLSTQFLSDGIFTPTSFMQHRIVSPIPKEDLFPEDAVLPKPKPNMLHVRCHSQMSAELLIGYSDHPFFYCIIFDLTSGTYKITTFGDPSLGNNSIVEPVFAAQPDNCNVVITGSQLGSICIYDLDTPQAFSSVMPARRCETEEDGAVTALTWSSPVLASGFTSGTTIIWDALTFERFRIFCFPTLHASPYRAVGGVSSIVVSEELLIIVVGNRVMSWKIGAVHSRDASRKGECTRTKKNLLS